MNRAGHIRARVAAVCLALAIGAFTLWQDRVPTSATVGNAALIDYPLASPDPRLARLSPLLAKSATGPVSPLADAPPQLVGIVGRIPDDAEVLVRLTGGGTTTISLNEEAQGWRAVAITAQSVTFEREGRRETVVMDAAGSDAQ